MHLRKGVDFPMIAEDAAHHFCAAAAISYDEDEWHALRARKCKHGSCYVPAIYCSRCSITFCCSSITLLTTSPIEINPITFPSSSTGRCRIVLSVMSCIHCGISESGVTV